MDGTIERVGALIRQGIWEGVDFGRAKSWYRQFQDRDLQLLGACLLDNLVYRSKPQFMSMLRTLMTCPQLLGPDREDDWSLAQSLSTRREPLIRLVPVISLDLPPTKSGTYVLRLLARSLRVRDEWMLWPERLLGIPNTVNTILLVDDFCGTGDQFIDFLQRADITQFYNSRPDCRVVYLAAVGHTKGISHIRNLHPKIEVIVAEELNTDHHFFSGSVLDQYGIPDLKPQLLEQYDGLCRNQGIGGNLGGYGYGDYGLCYAFAHSTPNNTLPIFWYHTPDWQPLLDR